MSTYSPAPPASTALAPVSSHHLSDTDVPNDFQLMMEMAKQLASAEHFLPTELQGKPGNVLALMFRARALNIPFAVACDELYIQKRSNKVAQSARLVRALARRAGHKFMTLESDRHHCVLLILLAGEKEPRRVEFTMQDAHRMGLTNPEGNNKGGQWDKQPENMLYARCTTRAVSRYCPEVMLGMGSDFLYDESPNEDEVPRDQEDILSAYREEDQKLVVQVLEAVKDTEYLEDGEEREKILLKLGMDYPQVLAYAADEAKEFTVRDVLLGKLSDARERKARQARGQEVPPATPFPTPQAGAQGGEKGDGPARARKAAGGRTGARARAAEEKAQRPQDEGTGQERPDRQQIFERVLKAGGRWDRRRFGGLHAELTNSHITGDRAAMLLKQLHEAYPERVQHLPGTRYTIVVDGQEEAPVKKAGVKRAAAPARLRAKAPTTQEPTRVGGVQAMADQGKRAAVADDKLMPCGCPADQVLFQNTHLKTCTEAGK